MGGGRTAGTLRENLNTIAVCGGYNGTSVVEYYLRLILVIPRCLQERPLAALLRIFIAFQSHNLICLSCLSILLGEILQVLLVNSETGE